MSGVLELRVYTLKPGTREAFDARIRTAIRPMFERRGIAVVYAGPSLHDQASYCLVRSFASVADRLRQLAAFYGSDEWRIEHNDAVMAMIASYNSCVIDADVLS